LCSTKPAAFITKSTFFILLKIFKLSIFEKSAFIFW